MKHIKASTLFFKSFVLLILQCEIIWNYFLRQIYEKASDFNIRGNELSVITCQSKKKPPDLLLSLWRICVLNLFKLIVFHQHLSQYKHALRILSKTSRNNLISSDHVIALPNISSTKLSVVLQPDKNFRIILLNVAAKFTAPNGILLIENFLQHL